MYTKHTIQKTHTYIHAILFYNILFISEKANGYWIQNRKAINCTSLALMLDKKKREGEREGEREVDREGEREGEREKEREKEREREWERRERERERRR